MRLRPIVRSDAPAIFRYASNPNVSRLTLWEPHETVKASLSYIEDYCLPYYARGVPEPLGIELKEQPGMIIGTVGCFWVSEKSKSMELAYAISEDHWGQGLVAEAALEVMDYCFREFHLTRIQARCKTENRASARVMEKIGMQYEGTLRSSLFHRSRYWDIAVYGILRT
jgi:ribosomal-protein-alanine N-acetyltransferase